MKKSKENSGIGRRMLREARPIMGYLPLAVALSVGSVCCGVLGPEILGSMTQKLYDFWAGGCAGSIRSSLVTGLAVLAAVYLGENLLYYANSFLMNNVMSRHYSYGLRIQMSEKLRRLPVRYVDQTPVGDVLERMQSDVSTMGGSLQNVLDIMIKGFFQILLISVLLLREDWRLALLVMALVPLSMVLSTKMAAKSEKYYDKRYEQQGKLTEIVEETFSNFATGKAYNLEEFTLQKHRAVNHAQRDFGDRANFASGIVSPLIAFSNSIAYVLINLVGGWLIVNRGVSVQTVVTVVLFARQFASPLEQIAYGMGTLSNVKAAAKRVFEILDMEEEPADGDLPQEPTRGRVEFCHTDFRYTPEKPLIEDLSFSVQPGQSVAIVGPTGAGKTTIVNLLMRFYDVNSGQILLDGQDISEIQRDALRSRIAMVLQDTWLFRGTIAENVAYGKPEASREEIEDACRRAHCDHFIRTMPDGYDTVIGEDSSNLSGGQRQMLTIARAFLADRPLLILDEATSNVDTRTELLIQQAMDELMRGKTCFVIAHRLSTIVNSDWILVLDHGRVVEQGRHRELLAQKGFYYRMFQSQYAM